MKPFAASVLGLCLTACASQAAPPAPTVGRTDLQVLDGGGWTGTLTYRDYSPPFGEVTLDVTAQVRVLPEGLVVALAYPAEPNANGDSTLELSPDGRRFGGDTITERSDHADVLRIVTTAPCEDDDRPATCMHRYQIGPKLYVSEKSVDFGDGEPPIVRNTFRLTR